MNHCREYFGEFLGTFILVLIGCGTVAVAVLFPWFGGVVEVALLWGIGVAIAIYATRKICPAHLNPAVSVAMVVAKKLPFKKLPFYVISQFLGAFVAGFLVYFIFNAEIETYELANNISRGSAASIKLAMIFGEFYPNPAAVEVLSLSTFFACLLECLGTFVLIFVIFRIPNSKKYAAITPVLIGLTVTVIIYFLAPYTQAGINPARDFGPRVVAYFMGWGAAAFPVVPFGFFTVYILSPVVGGVLAARLNV